MSQLSLFGGRPPAPRATGAGARGIGDPGSSPGGGPDRPPWTKGDVAEGALYPDGWSPQELPGPAATAAREEPALAHLAASVTVHRLHGEGRPLVTRGRRAGLAYLEQRALQRALARVAAARQILPAQEPATESEE